ncbi:MAG TPA: caspase family protein [Vicinamibacterales bacterium]|nr:caspase family protein [Vicinamibacterales bacterium]
MAKRAFIIAIENYKQMQEALGSTLKDTHKHALEFRDWLVKTRTLQTSDIFFCAEKALTGRTSDATRSAITQELLRFKDAAKDSTDDMFFYFSGHGFSYVDVDGIPTADVLLAADYVKREISGNACLKLDEIQKWLKMCLGTVTAAASTRCGHFYFIDACRNKITEREIKVAPLGLTFDHSMRKKAPVYTLCSTTTGTVASVEGGFPEALIDGLNGRGKAKRFFEGTFTVLFDSLRGYVERRLEMELDPRTEGGDGVILKLDPSLKYTCTVSVKNAAAQDEFDVEVKNDLKQVVESFTFTGADRTFDAPPDDYFVQVRPKTPADAIMEPSAPLPADLYENCALQFEKRAPEPGATRGVRAGTRGRGPARIAPAPTLPPTASVNIVVPDGAQVIVRGGKDKTEHLKASGMVELTPGTYRMELHDARGVIVDRREIALKPGPQMMDWTQLPPSPLRHALLGAIPGTHQNGVVDFSESLGPTPDQGLDLWLGLIGASRITGGPGDFSKLGPLPLATFDAAGDTAIYVLAGFDQPTVRLRAIITDDWKIPPRPVAQHASFPGLFEIVGPSGPPGFKYLTVQVDDNAPITIGTYALHGRGTLVTLAQKHTGALQIQQFILPLRKFLNTLPEGSGLWLDRTVKELDDVSGPLRLTRRCVEIQRAFARDEDAPGSLSTAELQSLVYFKWFEPIVAVLASYELARRGDVATLRIVVDNLRRHFKGLPDNEALARLAGLVPVMPPVPPLVLEGLQALNLMPDHRELPPAEALVFRGPWTMWRGL